MNTKANQRTGSLIQPNELQPARTGILSLLLLVTLPAVVQAQFTFVTNNSTITITGYTGPGGEVTIPSIITGLPVTGIGDYAFEYCYSLTSLVLPNSLTDIGDFAFSTCTSLTNFTIPTSVTSIGNDAFWQCFSLTSVAIPNGVTRIGDGAFLACRSLTNAMIGNNVTNIGSRTFFGCTSLSVITVDTLNPAYSTLDGVLFDKRQTTLLQYPGGRTGTYTVPNPVASIAVYAFAGCDRLTSVTIPNGLTNIGDHALQYCSGLTSVTMGSSVTTIGQGTFEGCTSLTGVTIPNSVTSIGVYAFLDCASLTAITVDSLNPAYSTLDGVLFDKRQTVLLQHPGGKTGSYTVPNSVTSIWLYAFAYCDGLTRVSIPNSVTTIAMYAFLNCTNLTAITVDALNPAYSTLDGVLFDKRQTTLLQYPGGRARSYTVPNSVTRIGDVAFGGCTSLTNVTIGNSVTTIGYYAFLNCTSLTNVTIPESVTSIEHYAFYWCTSLTGVYFQGNAPSLGWGVFDGDNHATVYYLPGTTGWGATYGGRPTALWEMPAAPNVTCFVQQPVLWPPNHKLANVGLTVTALDYASTLLPTTIQVFSNENDGDAASSAADTLWLRAARTGKAKAGRVYLVVAQAIDGLGSVGFSSCTAVVPHDASGHGMSAVNALAADAKSFCDSHNGAPPPGYFVIGDGPILGPKQ